MTYQRLIPIPAHRQRQTDPAQIETAKPKANVGHWISGIAAVISLGGVFAMLNVATRNRQWLEENQAYQARLSQENKCLTIAQFAAQIAVTRTESAAKKGIAAAARYDPNCANIEELATAFSAIDKAERASPNLQVARQGRFESKRTPTVKLADRFYLGEAQVSGFDIQGVRPPVKRVPYDMGGRAKYRNRGELNIPKGAEQEDVGLRPSIFVDMGTVLVPQTGTDTKSSTFDVGTQF
jgi:hypothetical protein